MVCTCQTNHNWNSDQQQNHKLHYWFSALLVDYCTTSKEKRLTSKYKKSLDVEQWIKRQFIIASWKLKETIFMIVKLLHLNLGMSLLPFLNPCISYSILPAPISLLLHRWEDTFRNRQGDTGGDGLILCAQILHFLHLLLCCLIDKGFVGSFCGSYCCFLIITSYILYFQHLFHASK